MLRRPWLLNIVLIAAIAVAGIRLAAYLGRPLPELPGPPPSAGADAGLEARPAEAGAPPETGAEAQGDYEVIAARDLFSQARGVAPPRAPVTAAPPPAKAQPAPKITLYGVVIVDGEKSAFLVEGGGDARPRKVREGEGFAGGTLRTIRNDGVTLTFPSGEVNVALRTPKDGGGGAPLPVMTPPGAAPSPARLQPGQRRFPAVQERRTGAVPAVPVPGAGIRRPGRVQPGPVHEDVEYEDLDEEDYDEDYDDEEFYDEEEDYYDEDY